MPSHLHDRQNDHPPSDTVPAPHDHFVQFYEDDSFLIDSLQEYIANGLTLDESVVVVATREHHILLEEALTDAGVDLDTTDGRYIALDASELLAKFMVDGIPDKPTFDEVVGDIVAVVAEDGRHVRIFGEMVAILWEEGNVSGAITLEEHWNDLAHSHRFTLFCAYPMSSFDDDPLSESFNAVCARHAAIVPSESYSQLLDPDERLRTVARLQQKTKSADRELEALKRKQFELEAELERVSGMDRDRSELLAMIAHDIRNPATVLSALLDIMKGKLRVADEATEELLNRSLASTHQIHQLIDDIGTVAQMGSGRFTYRIRPVDLPEVVRRTVADAAQIAHDTHFHVTIAPHLPTAFADQARQRQILTNLLTNAANYSPPNSLVSVSVGRRRNELVVRVRDEGDGIRDEDVSILFRPFSRLSRRPHPEVRGSGLGLYICKMLVEGQGGDIWAEARPGRGTTFSYTVPVRNELPGAYR